MFLWRESLTKEDRPRLSWETGMVLCHVLSNYFKFKLFSYFCMYRKNVKNYGLGYLIECSFSARRLD